MPDLGSMTFDSAGWQPDPSVTEKRVWRTPEGDGIVLYHIAQPTDLPSGLQSVEELRQHYVGVARGSPATVVETVVVTAAGRPAVRTIVKVRQQPHGMTYIGSLTLPFRDFCFIVKAQCREHGETGVREAIVFHLLAREGRLPKDPKERFNMASISDEERHDARFPNHPLSRLRRLMRHLESTAALDDATAAAEPFPLPTT